MERFLERARMEGGSLKAAKRPKVPVSVVQERMVHSEKVTGTKEQKKVKGWSTEEMKDKANSLLEEDTEEMRTRRGLNQDKIDQCWKRLAERMDEEVLDKYNVEDSKREAHRCTDSPLEWRRVRRSNK